MAESPDPHAHPEHYIAEWRDKYGWSQEDLAERAGVSHSTISRVEQGKVRIRAKLLQKLSKAFGLPRSMLLEVNPATAPEGTAELFNVWETMPGEARAQLLEIAKTFARRPK